MIWLINYLAKFLEAIINFVKPLIPQKFLNFLAPSFMEDNGKASGKRISAAYFSLMVGWIVWYSMTHELTSTKSDFVIWLVVTIIGYIALCFGMTYIPTRNKNENNTTGGGNAPLV